MHTEPQQRDHSCAPKGKEESTYGRLGGEFRPRSNREGVASWRAVWWSISVKLMGCIERSLSRDPYNKNSWDKWPVPLGLLFLITKIRDLRTGSLTDPYDYKTTDNKPADKIPQAAKVGNLADGSWSSDDENPQMGATGTRYSSNTAPQHVRPDLEQLLPVARKLAKVRWRKLDKDGQEISIPALILNDKAGGWIQFQFHGFGGNTKRDSITQNPHVVDLSHDTEWVNEEMIVDRTSVDDTRVSYDNRPTPVNERPHAWIQSQIYGGTEEELCSLRSFENGQMRFEDGRLPEDPTKPGIDLTGFSNNYNPQLSYLHWLFVKEHNAIADYLASFYPDWDDERLFRMAAKVNQANMARIHTDEWTRDLLQHPTLHVGMHADWYGLFGKKGKNYLMRLFYRHPWLQSLVKPITDNDIIWGMPGSRWEHFDGPFQVPKQFRMVYRLHELVRGRHTMLEPGTNRELGQHDLLDFLHGKTRAIVDRYGYAVLAYSFSKASAGALTLHNFPRALTNFRNQQNDEPTDLAALDLFREMTDGTGSYNEFRMSVGLEPVASFLELTGGNVDLAKELEVLYDYDIEGVHPGIGILAEPKPAGFALSYSQFYQFVLNAPRRLKSNRHMTDGFCLERYTPEGMSWVEHSGSMLDVEARHLASLPLGKKVVEAMEGVKRPFAPWPSAEGFPRRMLRQIENDSDKVLAANVVAFVLALVACLAGAAGGFLGVLPITTVAVVLLLPGVGLWIKRLVARWYMQSVVERAYTQRASEMFSTLYKAERWGNRAALLGRVCSLAAVGLVTYYGFALFTQGPYAAFLAMIVSAIGLTCFLYSKTPVIKFGGVGVMLLGLIFATQAFGVAFFTLSALMAFWTLRYTKTYQRDLEVLKVALLKRLRKEQPLVTPEDVPGATAIEKRYSFIAVEGHPVAKLLNTFRQLRSTGLSMASACAISLMSHVLFGRRTQRGMSWKQRRQEGIGLFGLSPTDIYLPNLITAQSRSNTRVYASVRNNDGFRPGDVDLGAFEEMWQRYAPGRRYMTSYDFSRMREGNLIRDAWDGRGTWISRRFGHFVAGHRHKHLMKLFADQVVSEDYQLVPAISREMLLQVYQGTAHINIMNERTIFPTGSLPEGGFKGRTKSLRGRDVMALFLKKDSRDNSYVAVLAAYERLRIPSPERFQITKWVPRMLCYRVEHASDNQFSMKPLRVSEHGEIEINTSAAGVDRLTTRSPGTLDGAVLSRVDTDGNIVEEIEFRGRIGSTWEDYVSGNFFKSSDSTGRDYFRKDVNSVLSDDRVATFEFQGVKGSYDVIEKVPGLFVFSAKDTDNIGDQEIVSRIGVFIDIVNWKPFFRTNELLTINPKDPADVGFFYERQ